MFAHALISVLCIRIAKKLHPHKTAPEDSESNRKSFNFKFCNWEFPVFSFYFP